MKKNMLMLLVVCASFVYGMEEPEKKWGVNVYGTRINLTKDYLCDAYAKMGVDIMVVGGSFQACILRSQRERGTVTRPLMYHRALDCFEVGRFECIGKATVYSYRDGGMRSKEVSPVWSIEEPCFMQVRKGLPDQGLMYQVWRKGIPLNCGKISFQDEDVHVLLSCSSGKNTVDQKIMFFKEKAIQEALNDLGKCYQIVLNAETYDTSSPNKKKRFIHKLLPKNKKEPVDTALPGSIALPALGVFFKT